MTHRIAAWSLALVFVAQLVNLWPMPGEAAAQRIALWSKLRADWESTDPSKSENPQWTAKAKLDSLLQIDEVLADPGKVLDEARVEWGLWLFSALISLGAAVAALRASRHWRWPVVGLLALFMWLQQPWRAFSLFFPEGQLDLARGFYQLKFISQYPTAFVSMLLLNVVVPLVLIMLTVYVMTQMARRNRHAL